MKLRVTDIPLQEAKLLHLPSLHDYRGSFSRLFCAKQLQEANILEQAFVQMNLSNNTHIHTLRGLHFQTHTHEEAKIIFCLAGKIFDVIVDLRQQSPTYMQHFSIELSPDLETALFVPKGFAHGFLTLEEKTSLLYLMSDYFEPSAQGGILWSDPVLNIDWPASPSIISEKDASLPTYEVFCGQ